MWRINKAAKYFFIVPVILSLYSCKAREATIPRPANAPNIIIVLADALRASELGCYGYSRPTSPFLDAFSKRGVRFARAYSHSTHTRLSIASLFTGLLPPQAKVRMGQVNKEDQGGVYRADILSEEQTTLAEILQAHGYHTMALITNRHLDKTEGFGQGFENFQYQRYRSPDKKGHLTGQQINKMVISMMEDRKKAAGAGSKPSPYFLYIHYMDVHQPYQPPPGVFEKLAGQEPNASLLLGNGMDLQDESTDIHRTRFRLGYDACIIYWDKAFRQLIETFEQKGWLENTLVIVMADHGEEFWEHDRMNHGFQVYDETMHIPLLLVGQNIVPENTVREDTAQVIDIFPTLCYLAGIPTKGLSLQGTNLFDPRRQQQGFDPLVYAETWQGFAPVTVRNNEYQLIYNSYPKTWELYDLQKDPAEKTNIYQPDLPAVKELAPQLLQMMGEPVDESKVPPRKLSEEQIYELKSLGYLK